MELDRTINASLRREFKQAVEEFGADLTKLQLRLAFLVLRFYLGEEWVQSKISLNESPDSFMLNTFDDNPQNRFMHMQRFRGLGNAIFLLRNNSTLETLITRFRERPTRPTFYEATIAADMVLDGFQISVQEEKGIKGNDFDFTAIRDNEEINIEITEKTGDKLTKETISNTLQQKRKQLPSTHAAIIYIIIPENWAANGIECEKLIRDATDEFFRGTGRINAVVFIYEIPITLGEGMAFVKVSKPYENNNARIPLINTRFLYPSSKYGMLHDFLNLINESVTDSIPKDISDDAYFLEGSIIDWCLNEGMLKK